MMPITMAGIGEKCKIQKIGGNEETRRFLANLGLIQIWQSTYLYKFYNGKETER